MVAAIVDAGPLVAFLDVAETHHQWAVEQVKLLDTPLLVCEPVLTETLRILRRHPKAQEMVFELVEDGTLFVAFRIEKHVANLRRLHRKYRDIPMSLADACIVVMAEIHDRHLVFTLDTDFTVYRKHGRVPLELLRPRELPGIARKTVNECVRHGAKMLTKRLAAPPAGHLCCPALRNEAKFHQARDGLKDGP